LKQKYLWVDFQYMPFAKPYVLISSTIDVYTWRAFAVSD
jgi:hypothetical protein